MSGPPAGRGFGATVRVCWAQPVVRIGLPLCLAHMAFMGFLAVYHTLAGTQVPENATPAQVWAVFPPVERASIILSGVVFAVGAALLALGLLRALRRDLVPNSPR